MHRFVRNVLLASSIDRDCPICRLAGRRTTGQAGAGQGQGSRSGDLHGRPEGALVVSAAGPSRASCRSRIALGQEPDRPVHPGRAGDRRAAARTRGRPDRPDPPRDVRPDRPASHARARSPRSWTILAPTPTSGWSTGCSRVPHYGERWAQHWLDLAHYADSNGFELDAERPDAWRYRDWVVHALNADMPYDRFLSLQLAGDEVEPGDPDGPDRHGLRPVRPARGRRRQRHPGSEAAERAHRDHRHGRLGLPRPHDRLRPLPRPQVRRDPDDRLLPPPVVLRGFRAGRPADRLEGRRPRRTRPPRRPSRRRRPRCKSSSPRSRLPTARRSPTAKHAMLTADETCGDGDSREGPNAGAEEDRRRDCKRRCG